MPSVMPYPQVLDLIQRRRPNVLDVLEEQYSRRLLSYAHRRWHLSDSEVEDVLFDTFYVLILKADSLTFTAQAQFDGYIYKVFANKLYEQFRKKRRTSVHELTYGQEIDAPEEANEEEAIRVPFQEADLNQFYEEDVPESPLVTSMQKALATLPDKDRQLLELWGQGYSYDEIGKILHLDPTFLKVKCFRAKQKVINWFNQHNTH